jgi:hypothetical protein
MKKAYLYNNYVVIEDGTNTFLFNIFQSFTVVNTNDYTIQSTIGNRAVILIADAPNWYDETGTIPYDAASLLLFLETYTGQYPQPTSSNGLPTGGTAGQILAKIDATNYNAEWIDNYANWTSQLKHEVKAGESLVKGQAVYVSSADGTNMIVSKASNTLESTSSKTMGLIAQSLAHNGKGFLITEGLLAGLNTSTATAGDPVWLGTNGNLIFGLTNKPSAPAHLVFIGIVTRSNSSNGEIFVKVQNGFELQELHNVAITSPANKNTILFNSTTSLWENRLIAIDDVTNLQTELNGKVAGSGTTNYVSKFTGSGTIGNSLIYDNGTNVGIGTSSPSHKLDVNGSFQTVGDAYFNGTNFYLNSSFSFIGNDATDLVSIGGNTIYLSGNGNVGIGTTTAGYRLSIYTGSLSNQSFNISDGTGNITIGHWDGANNRIELYGKETYFIQYGASYSMKFGVNGNEVLRLTPDGYAGFGTTNPFQKIHLYGGNLLVENGNIETTGSFALAQQFYDSTFSAGNPNQVLISNSVGTIWSDLKTVNGNSLVGTGDITISGGSGIHAQKTIPSGGYISQYIIYSTGPTTATFVINRLNCTPFIPNKTFTSQDLSINVTIAAVGGLAKILIFSDVNGVPSAKLFESSNLDCSTLGIKTALNSFTFDAGTTYWLGFISNLATVTYTAISQGAVLAFANTAAFSASTMIFSNVTFSSIPSTLTAINYTSGNIPFISIRKA